MPKPSRRARRGAIVILAALLMVVFFAVVALAVDSGYILLVKTQLQRAVDSAAIAAVAVVHESPELAVTEAQRFAFLNQVNGKPCRLERGQIHIGHWDGNDQNFEDAAQGGTAVRIRAEIEQTPLFFGRAIGRRFFGTGAEGSGYVEAVAMARPRDIVFVVDTSGKANEDSEFASGRLGSQPEYVDHMQELFDDLGLGNYPGNSESLGQPLGVDPANTDPLTEIASALQSPLVEPAYRVWPEDSPEIVATKVYSWIIDRQIAVLMPAARPAPQSTVNLAYWIHYIDYLAPSLLGAGSQLPLYGYNNNAKPSKQLAGKIGYLSYVQFMLDQGADGKIAGQPVPLSADSGECPWHTESTSLGTLSFPPRIEPEHSIRRAVIEVIGEIKRLNRYQSDSEYRDRVAIVVYKDATQGPELLVPLTDEYERVAQACAKLQATQDRQPTSSPQSGLSLASRHLQPVEQGGNGRKKAEKLVHLVLGGHPDSFNCSEQEILAEQSRTGDDNFFGEPDRLAEDATLMEVSKMRLEKWRVLVGAVPDTEPEFVKRLRKVSLGTEKPQAIEMASDPSAYEEALKRSLLDKHKRQFSLVQ